MRDGIASFPFVAPKGGQYHIVADARDTYGNPTESSIEIYAGDETPIDWGSQQQGHIRLVADKQTYHSGDVAHILVTTPYSDATALITTERGRILSYDVRRFTATATVLNIPVPPLFCPTSMSAWSSSRASAPAVSPTGASATRVSTSIRPSAPCAPRRPSARRPRIPAHRFAWGRRPTRPPCSAPG